jgi:hypothetical protein|tara:strand:- start:592 stop:723 length:132 start_codon:yes stop_codon:yes gene_type:complete
MDKFAYDNVMVVQAMFGYLNLKDQDDYIKFNIEDMLYLSGSSS